MYKITTATQNNILSAVKNLKLDDKYIVVLILGIGVIGLAGRAMEKGYTFSGSYDIGGKFNVTLSPSDKIVS